MRRRVRIPASLALILSVALPALAATETFTFDRAHTLIGFRIRHVVTKVEGRFKGFTGTIWLDRANPAGSKIELTIQTGSIDTAVEDRDKDLRSPNFFDVEKYPTITFKSSKVEAKGSDSYEVTGDFTMHGVTKTIRVPVKHTGFGKLGDIDKAGFEIALPLSRKDYGIDRGIPLLGDDVEINIQVEANKQAPEEKPPAKS